MRMAEIATRRFDGIESRWFVWFLVVLPWVDDEVESGKWRQIDRHATTF